MTEPIETAPNITSELCEALSKLTKSEWKHVKYKVDRLFDESTRAMTEPVFRQADAKTCGVSASEMAELLSG